MGGWRLGNTIDGCQAEYVRIPHAMANLTPVPDGLSDEQVLMCPDIMSTGFGGAESGRIRIGDSVAVFAQGPIGLCATVGARLRGASRIITVDGVPERLATSAMLGADFTVDFHREDPVERIMELTGGRGVDVAIEALGTQQTFESCLRVLKPGGVLSSLGVYSGKLELPLDAFAAGLGDHRIVTTLCPAERGRLGPRRPAPAGDAPLHPGPHRGGVRPLRPPARRRAQGGDHGGLNVSVPVRAGLRPRAGAPPQRTSRTGGFRCARHGSPWRRPQWPPVRPPRPTRCR
jgi:hypothetical protein